MIHRSKLGPKVALSSPSRSFVVTFVLAFVLIAMWSVATPLWASPDEPAHVARAVSLWRGEFIGHKIPHVDIAYTSVKVPRVYTLGRNVHGDHQSPCFAFLNTVPASCQHVSHARRVIPTSTGAGRYPPLYHYLVGFPSVLTTSTAGLYLMRLFSALFSALFVALAVMSVIAWSRKRLLLVGILLGATPMALFMGGTVNPSGLEITAALCLWCSGLILALERIDDPPLGLVVVVTVAASTLMLMRQLSPLWVALTFFLLLLLAGLNPTIRLLRRPAIRIAGLSIIIAGVLAIAWIRAEESSYASGHGLGARTGVQVAPGETNGHVLVTVFGSTGTWFQEMIGVFGWLDTTSPLFTYLVWYIGVGMIFVLTIVSARIRWSVILSLLAILVITVPVLLQYSTARNVGLYAWQGRYTLPFAVGIPLMAAAMLDGSEAIARVQARLTALLCGAIALASFLAFGEALRRYAVGVSGPLDYLRGSWSPPGGALAITTVYVVATLLFSGFLWCLVNSKGSDRFDLISKPRCSDTPVVDF
jgi:hypothetical protein